MNEKREISENTVDTLSGLAKLTLTNESNSEMSEINNSKDLAKVQLGDGDKRPIKTFTIPNIFNKVDEFKIDLKSALETAKVDSIEPKNVDVKKDDSIFIPQFVDCENREPILELSQDDKRQLIKFSQLRNRLKTVNCSRFSSVGRVIKKKFLVKRPSHVIHKFVPKNVLKAFNFEVPSPDDIILSHLNKKKS